MHSYSLEVVVFGGPSSVLDRKETKFKTTFRADSLSSAVCAVTGIFSGCNWFAVRGYVNTSSSNWAQYVTFFDTETGLTDYVDSDVA